MICFNKKDKSKDNSKDNNICSINFNKKAQTTLIAVIFWIILSFVIIVFFALYNFAFGELTDILTSIPNENNINISTHAQSTFGKVNVGLGQLEWIAFLLIMLQVIVIFGVNLSKRGHPALYVAYFLVNGLAVVVAVIISNVYEDLLSNPIFGNAILEFSAGTFLMLNLPAVATAIGFLGFIFLAIAISRDSEISGGAI